jgi:hypothetical protein
MCSFSRLFRLLFRLPLGWFLSAGAFPFMDDERIYQWALPDVDAAAFHMRRLYEDPKLGLRLGEAVVDQMTIRSTSSSEISSSRRS